MSSLGSDRKASGILRDVVSNYGDLLNLEEWDEAFVSMEPREGDRLQKRDQKLECLFDHLKDRLPELGRVGQRTFCRELRKVVGSPRPPRSSALLEAVVENALATLGEWHVFVTAPGVVVPRREHSRGVGRGRSNAKRARQSPPVRVRVNPRASIVSSLPIGHSSNREEYVVAALSALADHKVAPPERHENFCDFGWHRSFQLDSAILFHLPCYSQDEAFREARRLFDLLQLALIAQRATRPAGLRWQGDHRSHWKGLVGIGSRESTLQTAGWDAHLSVPLVGKTLSRRWRQTTAALMGVLEGHDKKDDLAARIRRAASMLRASDTVDERPIQFVSLMIGLECIAGRRSRGGGDNVRDVVAQLLGTDLADRRRIHTCVHDLYKKRSAIVHAGVADALRVYSFSEVGEGLDSANDLERAEWLLKQAILAMARAWSNLVAGNVSPDERDQRFLDAVRSARFERTRPRLVR